MRITGRTVVDAVHIALQNHRRVSAHHRGDEARQLVVIGEHQFGDAHRVILVHDGMTLFSSITAMHER